MDLLLVALLLLAVAAAVAVALGAVRGPMAPVDNPVPPPLEEPVRRPVDLDRARFGLALRGYRMDQVDAVLDEARDLLQAKDEEIDRLEGLALDVPDAVARSSSDTRDPEHDPEHDPGYDPVPVARPVPAPVDQERA